jgi:hypothetical protein
VNLGSIRTALKATLNTTFAGRVATEPPDQVTVPMAVISGPDPVTYSETWDAGHHLTFTVRVLVERAVTRSAQSALDTYMGDGAGSVYAALEADKDLGGSVASAQVTSAQNLGSITIDQVTYAAVDFTVDVMT